MVKSDAYKLDIDLLISTIILEFSSCPKLEQEVLKKLLMFTKSENECLIKSLKMVVYKIWKRMSASQEYCFDEYIII